MVLPTNTHVAALASSCVHSAQPLGQPRVKQVRVAVGGPVVKPTPRHHKYVAAQLVEFFSEMYIAPYGNDKFHVVMFLVMVNS